MPWPKSGLNQMLPQHEVISVGMCLLNLGQLGTSLSFKARARRKGEGRISLALQKSGGPWCRQVQAVSYLESHVNTRKGSMLRARLLYQRLNLKLEVLAQDSTCTSFTQPRSFHLLGSLLLPSLLFLFATTSKCIAVDHFPSWTYLVICHV